MKKAFNRNVCGKVLIIGSFLRCGELTLEASIPYFSGWKDRNRLDSRIVIGNKVGTIDQLDSVVDGYLAGKTYTPNQMVVLGYYLPIIYYAACLKDATSLKKLLADSSVVATVQTSLGITPMHAAAINSSECLQALIDDGRLNINEHSIDGKTPLYMAMECNNQQTVQILLLAQDISVNSRENVKGQTMLHVAVREGNANVVKQILALLEVYGADRHTLEVNPEDVMKKTPADYLDTIIDASTKKAIQNALADAGAQYGPDNNGANVPMIE